MTYIEQLQLDIGRLEYKIREHESNIAFYKAELARMDKIMSQAKQGAPKTSIQPATTEPDKCVIWNRGPYDRDYNPDPIDRQRDEAMGLRAAPDINK
jgi:hypothetical protein